MLSPLEHDSSTDLACRCRSTDFDNLIPDDVQQEPKDAYQEGKA